VAAAIGHREELGKLYRAALQDGVDVAGLQEATLQVFLFAGYPRTINAFQALAEALDGAAPPPPCEADPGDEALARRGRQLFDRIYGPHAQTVADRLERLHPDFARFTLRDAYGQVLGRPFLPILERELMAVAMLAALGLGPQLRAHVLGALRVGADAESVRAALHAAESVAGELGAARETIARALASPR